MANVPSSEHGPYLTPEEQRRSDDYDWALRDPEVQATYRGQVVAVYLKRVLGAGKDHTAAVRAARKHPDCAEQYNVLAKVYIEGTPLVFEPRRGAQP